LLSWPFSPPGFVARRRTDDVVKWYPQHGDAFLVPTDHHFLTASTA